MKPPVRLEPGPSVVFALRYESRSKPGTTYDVALHADGAWSCECWPWLKLDSCTHVSEARRLFNEERRQRRA